MLPYRLTFTEDKTAKSQNEKLYYFDLVWY